MSILARINTTQESLSVLLENSSSFYNNIKLTPTKDITINTLDGKRVNDVELCEWMKRRFTTPLYASAYAGTVKFANDEEVASGDDDYKVVTPAQVWSIVNSETKRVTRVVPGINQIDMETIEDGVDYIYLKPITSITLQNVPITLKKGTTFRFIANNTQTNYPPYCPVEANNASYASGEVVVKITCDGRITATNFSTAKQTTTAEGCELHYNTTVTDSSYRWYGELINPNTLHVRARGVAEYVYVYNSAGIRVSNGGIAYGCQFSGTGIATNDVLAFLHVSEGGIVSSSYFKNAQINVSRNGMLKDCMLDAPYYGNFKPGCIISGGTMYRSAGVNTGRYIASDCIVNDVCLAGSGNVLTVSGADTTVNNLMFTESAKVVYSGVSVLNSPKASNCSGNNGIVLSSGMSAYDATIYRGGKILTYGRYDTDPTNPGEIPTIVSNLVMSGGVHAETQDIASALFMGGRIDNIETHDVTQIVVTSSILNNLNLHDKCFLTTRSGAIVTNVSGDGNGLIRVSNGSIVSNVTVLSGCTLYTGASSYASSIVVGNSGWYIAYNYCSADDVTIQSGGSAMVSAGGLLNSVMVLAGGTLTIDSANYIAYSGNENEIPSCKGGSALKVRCEPGGVVRVLSGTLGAGYIEPVDIAKIHMGFTSGGYDASTGAYALGYRWISLDKIDNNTYKYVPENMVWAEDMLSHKIILNGGSFTITSNGNWWVCSACNVGLTNTYEDTTSRLNGFVCSSLNAGNSWERGNIHIPFICGGDLGSDFVSGTGMWGAYNYQFAED